MNNEQAVIGLVSATHKGTWLIHDFVDITGDLISGLLLSQIIYWYRPSESGKTKLRVWKHGELWLAKRHSDWYDEIRVSEYQAGKAIKQLEEAGFIKTKLFRFDGSPTTHIQVNFDKVAESLSKLHVEAEFDETPKFKDSNTDNLRIGNTKNYAPLTETTTETTTESTKIPRSTSGKPSVDKFNNQTKGKNPAKNKEPHHNQQSVNQRALWGIAAKHFPHDKPSPDEIMAVEVIAGEWSGDVKDFTKRLVDELHVSAGRSFFECALKAGEVI